MGINKQIAMFGAQFLLIVAGVEMFLRWLEML